MTTQCRLIATKQYSRVPLHALVLRREMYLHQTQLKKTKMMKSSRSPEVAFDLVLRPAGSTQVASRLLQAGRDGLKAGIITGARSADHNQARTDQP